ncbi:SPFH domain-containing protein [Peptostreptococcus anaerobius]|uniref:SPFH domain-containing protein n=1 Tax=Peptostreptococcus anaerobius TaxID=1261 RepID=UPI00321B2CE7
MVRSVITTVLILLVLLVVVRSIRIVKQARMGIIMRLGKFHTEAKTGIHLLVPFIDTMSYMIDLREMVVDFPPQPVIIKDNVTMQIDTVVYYKITDPKSYVFEIANPISAIENLTATTLRNIIGDLDLDETLTSRDLINAKMRTILDEATDIWGIKVNRVELKNIMPPRDIQAAMEKQMRAERERREAILQAEGEKQSKILIAEGEKQSAILRAEAKKESMIREAEGERESKILEAQGEAEAIRNKKLAEADGIRSVFTAMKEANVDDNILALKSMEAIEKLGESPSSKLVLPSDAVNFLGTFKGIKEVMSDKESK